MARRGSVGAIKIEGLRDFQAALRAADRNLPKELGAANKEIAEIVAREARRRAPEKTGRLKKSIRGLKVQRSAVVRMGGARVPYAPIQEFGWPARGIASQAFLYPAIASTRAEVIEAYGEMIDKLMRRAFPNPVA